MVALFLPTFKFNTTYVLKTKTKKTFSTAVINYILNPWICLECITYLFSVFSDLPQLHLLEEKDVSETVSSLFQEACLSLYTPTDRKSSEKHTQSVKTSRFPNHN